MGAADPFFQRADQALKKKGGYDYAIDLLQQGLEIDPDRLEERQKLRSVAARRCVESGGNTLGSRMVLMKHVGSRLNLKKLAHQKKYEEQIVLLEKLLADAPQNAEYNMTLARAFEATERLDSALWAYNIVVEVDRKNGDAYKALARIHEGRKEFDKAIQYWERVREVSPEDQEASKAIRDNSAAAMMGRAEARQADGSGTFRDLLKDETEAEKLQKKASLIRTEDDAMTAITFKKEEIANNPPSSRLYRDLGDLYLKHLSDFDTARTCFEKAREIDPTDLHVAEKLATLSERKLEREVENLRIELKQKPDDAGVKARLVEVQLRQKNFLADDYRRRVEAHPTDYGLKFQYGKILYEANRWDEGIAQFQKASKDPKFATGAHHFIGKSFFSKKLYDLAIKEYNTALGAIAEADSEPGKEVRFDLGVACEAKGDKDQALHFFEEVMALDIGYRDVSQRVDKLRGM